ncbi:52 kDa repressor of the inhibitor of the protein kinase-like [Mizuhopecten yessoensis]|uniref:52 kDa repressor of the inhibitor of the protein kinase-like n=1 Tax=Mizuhopecten yessoensis TaxID=6573 RepID=UPI000B45AE93|nr:52 kDa repressor of the inhibitor of the protein kinase-like [Mizuhopecten yessoensis]
MKLTPNVVSEQPTGALPSGVQSLADRYSEDLPSPDSLLCEYHRWWRKWQANGETVPPATIRDALQSCEAGFYPNLNILLRMLCTVPVTTAKCERSISTIRRLKTYLHSTMKSERLNGLALMTIHYGISVDIGAVVSDFASSLPTRMKFDSVDFLRKS